MFTLLTLIHIAVCLVLILVVLLQSGKAADLAGAFGGMGSQTAFGPRGAQTLLSKTTTACAILFMLTSLTLAIMATRQVGASGSILEKSSQPAPAQKAPAPATPQPQQQQPAPNPPAGPAK
jgi:preprotein translocase subunit SecG